MWIPDHSRRSRSVIGNRRLHRALVILIGLCVPLTSIPLRPIPAFAASSYSSTVLADSPAAYWRLGEATGTTMSDATSNSNSGTYVGGYTLGQAGAVQGDSNTAVSLNGATGAATAPNSSTLQVNQVAIELWVKKSAPTGNGMYVTKNVAVAGGAGTSWFQLMNAQDAAIFITDELSTGFAHAALAISSECPRFFLMWECSRLHP